METLAELKDFVDGDAGLSQLRETVARTLGSDDQSHDLAHALRVALWTVRLGGHEVNPREAIAAALCHDLVNLPKNSPDREVASGLSAKVACQLLPALGFNPEVVSMIAEAIRDHSYSRDAIPASALGRALQDADRLEALGAIGIMRTLITGVRMGIQCFDPVDPWAVSRELDDQVFTIDHFFVKLLRLRKKMCTVRGRSEAERRTRIMEEFLDALAGELAAPRPALDNEGGGQ